MSLGLTGSRSQALETKFSILEKYDKMGALGGGAYSNVYKGRCHATKKSVAIKIVDTDVNEGLIGAVVREIALLKELHHPNIVALIECETIEIGTALVLEHCPRDLEKYMRQRREAGRPLHQDPDKMRMFMAHLLLGLTHCHAKNVLHRDLKPANLLIDRNEVLKIADFGLARQIGFHPKAENLTNVVVTLWYRAPELLQPPTTVPSYGAAIDVWSCGCIFAEMVADRPIFCGASNEQILLQYIQFIPAYGIQSFLNTYHPNQGRWPPQALNLLYQMLKYDAQTRITAAKALAHSYFPAQYVYNVVQATRKDSAPLSAVHLHPGHQSQIGPRQLPQAVPYSSVSSRPPDERAQPRSVHAAGQRSTAQSQVRDTTYAGGASSRR